MPCSPRSEQRRVTRTSCCLASLVVIQAATGCQSGPATSTALSSATRGAVSTAHPSPGAGSTVTSAGLQVSGSTSRASLDAFAAQAATARTWVERTWPQQVAATGTISVIIADSAARFAQLRGGAPDTDDLAASTTSNGTVIVSQQALSAVTVQGRRVVLAHELTHVVLQQTRRAGLPPWVVEGSAEYTAYRWAGLSLSAACPTLRDQVLAGQVPTLPPGDELFDSSSTQQSAYQQAHAYMSFLVARFGLAAWKRFVLAAGSGSATAFGSTFGGSTPAALRGAYLAYLGKVMRGSSGTPQ